MANWTEIIKRQQERSRTIGQAPNHPLKRHEGSLSKIKEFNQSSHENICITEGAPNKAGHAKESQNPWLQKEAVRFKQTQKCSFITVVETCQCQRLWVLKLFLQWGPMVKSQFTDWPANTSCQYLRKHRKQKSVCVFCCAISDCFYNCYELSAVLTGTKLGEIVTWVSGLTFSPLSTSHL